MQSDSRIVVTGMGIISALGRGLSGTMQSLQEMNSGIRPISLYETDGLYCQVGAEVPLDDFPSYSHREDMLYDRTTQLALIAARDAIEHAGIDIEPERTGIVLGVGVPGRQTTDAVLERYYTEKKRIPPMTIFRGMPNAAAAHIAIQHNITGPSNTVSTACSSGNQAVINAAQLLASGMADVVIVGAADSPFTRPFHESWEALRILSRGVYSPFSTRRDGILLGEGSAFLVLETEKHAISRSAQIYAYITSYGSSTDAMDIAAPSETGMAQAIRQTLNNADIGPEDISAICAHGTGTAANDTCESRAINKIFSNNKDVPVFATKPFHGHALGASALIEAIISILSMEYSFIPPTLNCEDRDPECDINLVTQLQKTESHPNHILNNSFAFGGSNVSVLLSKN